MSKSVIIANFPLGGYNRVFGTLAEASEALGVHPSTISRAVVECSPICGGVRVRYGDRVFAVRKRGELDWRLVKENARGTGYVVYGNPEERVLRRDVDEVRDVTAGWYWHGI